MLEINVTGQGSVDIYSAIRFPDKSFVTLSAAMEASELNEVISFLGPLQLSISEAFPVIDVVLPDGLTTGDYSAFGIVVEAGANVLDSSNWISLDEVQFEVL